MCFGAFPLSSRIMCVRRDSGVKTLARMQARQLDLLVSAQTTLLAARRVLAQRCKTNERSRFLLESLGMLKNTCGKWHLSGGWRRPPSPSMASRQPVDVHATAADELRILGRRLEPILIISKSVVVLQHKPGAGEGVRRRRSGRPRHVGPLGASRSSSTRPAPSGREMSYSAAGGLQLPSPAESWR